jgi:predicted transcriptional regulator
MAKSKKRIEARNLRKKGLSIREIAEKIEVSKSSVSI